MGLRVEDGGGSEGPFVAKGIGVEPSGYDRERNRMATSPHAKAGRLPNLVARHERVWRTTFEGEGK